MDDMTQEADDSARSEDSSYHKYIGEGDVILRRCEVEEAPTGWVAAFISNWEDIFLDSLISAKSFAFAVGCE